MDFLEDLQIPKTLGLSKDLTFGIEIEFEKVGISRIEEKLNIAKKNKLIGYDWVLRQDGSLKKYTKEYGLGCEITSPILTDNVDSYKKIRNACHMIKELGGVANEECGGHIHIGSNIFNDDIKKYIRLMKLWAIYENKIIRFSLGENSYKRYMQDYYAAPCKKLFSDLDENMTYNEFIGRYATDKKRAISFFYLNSKKSFHTIEVRCPSGTLEYKIWKNNINFFSKLFLCCLDENKDWDLIDRKFADCYFDKSEVEELVNFVFDKDIDKQNFIIQYEKDSKVLVR